MRRWKKPHRKYICSNIQTRRWRKIKMSETIQTSLVVAIAGCRPPNFSTMWKQTSRRVRWKLDIFTRRDLGACISIARNIETRWMRACVFSRYIITLQRRGEFKASKWLRHTLNEKLNQRCTPCSNYSGERSYCMENKPSGCIRHSRNPTTLIRASGLAHVELCWLFKFNWPLFTKLINK